MRHWSRYGVNGALEMTFMNYEQTLVVPSSMHSTIGDHAFPVAAA